jgi:hypothetical protein
MHSNSVFSACEMRALRDISATQAMNRGHCSICFWPPAISASTFFFAGSVMATADHHCMFELVAADCAAAISVSTVPAGSGSGL